LFREELDDLASLDELDGALALLENSCEELEMSSELEDASSALLDEASSSKLEEEGTRNAHSSRDGSLLQAESRLAAFTPRSTSPEGSSAPSTISSAEIVLPPSQESRKTAATSADASAWKETLGLVFCVLMGRPPEKVTRKKA
jgi:hypothetical protein